MVLAAPTVLPHLPPARRGLAGGVIFTGVGLGIAASGTLVPLFLLQWGLTGVVRPGRARTRLHRRRVDRLAARRRWAPDGHARRGARAAIALERQPEGHLPRVRAQRDRPGAPHGLSRRDFVARGLGRGLDIGGRYWVLFGVGAILGPVLAGRAADRIGFRSALRWALALQVAAVGGLAIWTSTGWLIVSSVLIGAFVPGVVPLVLGRVQELAAPDARTAAWGRATTAFAIGLTAAGYGFSFVYARTDELRDAVRARRCVPRAGAGHRPRRQASGGRRPAHAVQPPSAAEARSTLTSAKRRPTICSPIGESAAREAARDGGGRLARHVEGEREGAAGLAPHLLCRRSPSRRTRPMRSGGLATVGDSSRLVLLEEGPRVLAHQARRSSHACIVPRRRASPHLLDDREQAGIDLCPAIECRDQTSGDATEERVPPARVGEGHVGRTVSTRQPTSRSRRAVRAVAAAISGSTTGAMPSVAL